jgi:hypothetical protein
MLPSRKSKAISNYQIDGGGCQMGSKQIFVNLASPPKNAFHVLQQQ